jgi:hypothetical protein
MAPEMSSANILAWVQGDIKILRKLCSSAEESINNMQIFGQKFLFGQKTQTTFPFAIRAIIKIWYSQL